MEDPLGIVVTCLICILGGGLIAALLVQVAKNRMLDERITQLETGAAKLKEELAKVGGELAIDGPLPVRVARLEAFMRPDNGELAPRLAQLEQQQAVDSSALAEQARAHHKYLRDLDERMQHMARDIRADRPTAKPPRL